MFLHDYDAARDTDGSVLTPILTAPVEVASWINLQYYGSTVNNRIFGSGNKVLHNVVGCFGVWEGNAGDLRTGLPLQSLHDGHQWIHEPLRLQVLIEAPRDRVCRALDGNASIRNLAEGGWLQLVSIESNRAFLYLGASEWREMPGQGAESTSVRWNPGKPLGPRRGARLDRASPAVVSGPVLSVGPCISADDRKQDGRF